MKENAYYGLRKAHLNEEEIVSGFKEICSGVQAISVIVDKVRNNGDNGDDDGNMIVLIMKMTVVIIMKAMNE